MLLATALVTRDHSILLLRCSTDCYTVVEKHIEIHKAGKYKAFSNLVRLVFYELKLPPKSYLNQKWFCYNFLHGSTYYKIQHFKMPQVTHYAFLLDLCSQFSFFFFVSRRKL